MLTSGTVRKYRPLLTEDTGIVPKNVPWVGCIILL